MFFTPKRYKEFGAFPDVHLRPSPPPSGPARLAPRPPTRNPPAFPRPPPPSPHPPPTMPSDAVALGVCSVRPLTIVMWQQVSWPPNVAMKPAGKVYSHFSHTSHIFPTNPVFSQNLA